MNKGFFVELLLVLVLFFSTDRLCAQLVPAEGSQLHYRIIGFSFAGAPGAGSYMLEVAEGTHNSEGSFRAARLSVKETKDNRVIAEVPSFGSAYTWRVTTKVGGKERKGKFNHFTTLPNPLEPSITTRLRVVERSAEIGNIFVFVDCTKALYNAQGEVVWFMPGALVQQMGLGGAEDLKCTPQGTIIYLKDGQLNEITYDGKVLGKFPVSGLPGQRPGGNAHHDAMKLSNGHYMALGDQPLTWKLCDTGIVTKSQADTNGGYQTNIFGTVNEYDATGQLVWQYNSADYALHSDVMNLPSADGKFNIDIHPNAFFFDEKNGVLFLGCKNISRILKIHYPDRRLMNVIGRPYKSGDKDLDHELFCQQHAITAGAQGEVYVFSNNTCGTPPLPKLVVLKEDHNALYGATKLWEYEWKTPGSVGMRSRGGNVTNLPDSTIFASLSSPYGDIFMVNRKKNILWHAVLEKKEPGSDSWTELSTYRSAIVPDHAALERMIWYRQ